MATSSVRVSKRTYEELRQIAARHKESVQSVIDKAVEEYRRKEFFDAFDTAYAALQDDANLWANEVNERKLFESSLPDELDTSEVWTEDGRVIARD